MDSLNTLKKALIECCIKIFNTCNLNIHLVEVVNKLLAYIVNINSAIIMVI